MRWRADGEWFVDRRCIDATRLIDGTNPVELMNGVIGFPVPGHTEGSVLFVVDDGLLFCGHGWNHDLDPDRFRTLLHELVERMADQ